MLNAKAILNPRTIRGFSVDKKEAILLPLTMIIDLKNLDDLGNYRACINLTFRILIGIHEFIFPGIIKRFIVMYIGQCVTFFDMIAYLLIQYDTYAVIDIVFSRHPASSQSHGQFANASAGDITDIA